MPRMRYAAEALEELRRADPQTAVTLNFIRTLIRKGIIPSSKVGRGHMINMDHLEAYLANPTPIESAPDIHGIRRIDERAGA